MRVLLFAGTSEGRLLAERLSALPVELTVSVATDYGRETLRGLPEAATVLTGRLDAAAIERLLREGGFTLAVDATHPYAVAATDNVRTAAARAGVPVLRLLRDKGADGDFVHVGSAAEAASRLSGTSGNVLLAIGAKELSAFVAVPDFAARLYPRVLPTTESIAECERLGFRRAHIIAMQGPFGVELNRALFRQFDIAVMVTKDGGRAGGFPEKIRAAEEAAVRVVVIGRPIGETGLGMDETLAAIVGKLEAETK